MQKILVLASVYPQTGAECPTPVVHYFVKEWVKMGYEVEVVHTISGFPKFFYAVAAPVRRTLRTLAGHYIPAVPPVESDEVMDGAVVHHRVLKKWLPYAPVSAAEFGKVMSEVETVVGRFHPDVVIAHWDNPQLQILHALKQKYNLPTFLVLHGKEETLLKKYGDNLLPMMQSLNALGFRNMPEKEKYEKLYGPVEHCFFAFSGVAQNFVEIPLSDRNFDSVSRLVFVGGLIGRKHPESVVAAASRIYPDKDFHVTYIGEGKMRDVITSKFGADYGANMTFTGKIPREDIVKYLDESDIFVMISEGEVFGLVYLEAMSRGCLTIAARGEGIDGIIVDGENGFLCAAGDEEELAGILRKIASMPADRRAVISRNAIETARRYTDKKVAEDYIESVKSFV